LTFEKKNAEAAAMLREKGVVLSQWAPRNFKSSATLRKLRGLSLLTHLKQKLW